MFVWTSGFQESFAITDSLTCLWTQWMSAKKNHNLGGGVCLNIQLGWSPFLGGSAFLGGGLL